MNKLIASALFGLVFAVHSQQMLPIVLEEDFSSNPAGRWSTYGDAELFRWNSANGNLEVTWDSSQPKSFFYFNLGRTITRADSFRFEFDLQLEDIISGHEPGKNGPMQIGIGLLNIAATNADWSRVEWSPNVAEFNVYPSGFYPGFNVLPTTSPAFVSGSGAQYAPISLDEYIMEFPRAQRVRIRMAYDAPSQTLTSSWTTNGVVVGTVHHLALTNSIASQFRATNDFQVNIFAISSYKSNEGMYANSLLAHGSLDNISIDIPAAPDRSRIAVNPVPGVRGVVVHTLPGRTYTLERTTDFSSWTPVLENIAGTGADIALTDSTALSANGFYRVRIDE